MEIDQLFGFSMGYIKIDFVYQFFFYSIGIPLFVIALTLIFAVGATLINVMVHKVPSMRKYKDKSEQNMKQMWKNFYDAVKILPIGVGAVLLFFCILGSCGLEVEPR